MKFLSLVLLICEIHFVIGVSIEKDLSLTFKEKQILDKFRERVKPLLKDDYMKNDIYLIRWLRARSFNLDAAETMFKENLKWRKENKMDKIHLENFDDMERDFFVSIDTYDRQGRPRIVNIGEWDIRSAVLQGKGQRLLRHMDRLLENITTQVFQRQALGMNVTQWKVLSNCDGFNLITHGCPICIPLWVQFISSLENHFPGYLDELIVIEAPPAVHAILDILRPFLSQNTREALRIFNSNRRQWMKYLDERIARSERRKPYGGTKPDVEFH